MPSIAIVYRADGPPYELTFRVEGVEAVVGQQQFVVERRDEDGDTIRRYVRTVPEFSA